MSSWALASLNRELTIYEWALVNDGRRLAVRAALANLMARGAITRTLNGYRRVETSTPEDPLEAEVVTMATRDTRVDVLLFRVCRGRALTSAVRTLTEQGFLEGPRVPGLGALHRALPGGLSATALGERALSERRDAQEHQRPGSVKSEPGIAIALFGTDHLWQDDPDLALRLGLNIVGAPPNSQINPGQY